jgi:hypothetical protein
MKTRLNRMQLVPAFAVAAAAALLALSGRLIQAATYKLSGTGNSFSTNPTVNAGVLQLNSGGGAGSLWGAVAYRRIRRLLG